MDAFVIMYGEDSDDVIPYDLLDAYRRQPPIGDQSFYWAFDMDINMPSGEKLKTTRRVECAS